jgi:transposase InsO family protein
LWHQRLGHLHLKGMKRALSSEAIRGLPNLKIVEDNICGECQIGKQTRMSHPRLAHQATSKVLKLLHMDLMGPMHVESIGRKMYVLVVVDDFSRFTWVNFIREKSNTFDVIKELCTQLQREKGCGIVRIKSDHGTEFENSRFYEYCSEQGIKHEFSSPITPQQNGVVERKNRTLQESARVMLHAKHLPYHLWAEAMNTACHIHNRVTLRTGTTTTLYELWKGRKPTVKYFHVFGSKCYILSDRDYRRKMDPKSDEGSFLDYSTNSRAYRVFNLKTETVMESINVVIDDVPKEKVLDVDPDVETFIQETNAPVQVNEVEPEKDETEDVGKDKMSTTKGPSIRI